MASESPQVRRRPTRAKLGDPQRDSNVVRASVLETALELGFSQNSTVADWIFNNPLSEEPEDLHPEPDNQAKHDTKSDPAPDIAEVCIPLLFPVLIPIAQQLPLSRRVPIPSSDESSSLNSPSNNAPSAAVTAIQVHTHKPSVTESPHVHFGDFSSDHLQLFSPFALSPHGAHHGEIKGNSLGKFPRDSERSRSQDDGLCRNPSHESPSPGPADIGYTSEGQYLSIGKVSKGKDNPGKLKGNKGLKPKALDISKTGEKDGDYASDGGYLSASSNKSQGKSPSKVKSRAMAFFRRRPKKYGRGSDDEDEDSIPPVPAIPILPRPSSPKPLERRAAPSSPTRSGFSPLTLNLTNPPASPPKRRVSKSPPPVHARATLPQRSDHFSLPQWSASPLAESTSAPTLLTSVATAATFPLPPSMPGTPLSTASFPATLTPPSQLGTGAGSIPKSLTAPPSRHHLSIPPPAPPPTLPLPQPPPSPSTLPNGMLPPLPATPTTPSRRGSPARPIPVVPTTPGSTRPLTPRRAASPFRPLLSPRTLPSAVSHTRNGENPNGSEGNQFNGEVTGRQRSGTAGLGSTPAFLQRRIQHGLPPSPRPPPPDVPLPPSPGPSPSTRPHTVISSPSKFHEHLSSVSSVPLSQFLSTPMSMSPSPSIATLSGSSSGLSVRSSHVSSASDRSEEPANHDSLNVLEYSRPTTSASTFSEVSYGQPITSRFSRPTTDVKSQFSDRSEVSSSIYSPTMHRDNSSVTTYDDDGADVDDTAPKSCVDEDEDDASMYPSDDKTAGRRTMYLVEHGELDENGDEIVIAGSHYWSGHEVPPPLPPLPPMPTRPGPGYF
ncbi:hypothetical protein J3R83DRAFT_9473 [Lanmaoa asiatica]|nr:hypothetical protein J3R83DRAFT_9473 [Lanmaoa asiatica]